MIGNAGQANYAASKAGIIGFTKSCAKELAVRNITVNAIAPGFIETRMTDAIPEDIKQNYLKLIPMKRFGKPDDVANLALFLSSDRSSYITGQILCLDGGMVM
jgi:3-oxoacyl-[acyl-carrier protein] reductase